MIRHIRNILRLIYIAFTLARYNALFPLEYLQVAPFVLFLARIVSRRNAPGRPGQRLASALQKLGPSFIKAGQTLATRADLLSEEVAADLSALQDRLPPFSAKQARETIERELEQPVPELFAEFNDTPVAAASIAQVHHARVLEDDGTPGREVAVKVLRPDVEKAFARDIDLFYWLAELVEAARPDFRRLKPVEVVQTFQDTVAIEMDLRLEAAAAAELRDNFRDDPWFRVPDIDWPRTSRRVLTTEWVSGIPVDEPDQLAAAGHDATKILEHAAQAFFNQVFRDGYFHADQHPGNSFVAADGGLVAVDFGIMGRLERKTRTYLADMLMGFLTRDYRRVAEVHFEAGYVPANKDVGAFTQALRSIGEPILGKPMNEISIGRLLGQLFQVTETFEMETQPQLLLLQKTMVVTEGVGRILNPDVNMWELAMPLIAEWMRENRGPEARIRDAALDLAVAAQKLPKFMNDVGQAAEMLSEGGLRLHPKTVHALSNERRLRPALLVPLWLTAISLAVLAAAALLD